MHRTTGYPVKKKMGFENSVPVLVLFVNDSFIARNIAKTFCPQEWNFNNFITPRNRIQSICFCSFIQLIVNRILQDDKEGL